MTNRMFRPEEQNVFAVTDRSKTLLSRLKLGTCREFPREYLIRYCSEQWTYNGTPTLSALDSDVKGSLRSMRFEGKPCNHVIVGIDSPRRGEAPTDILSTYSRRDFYESLILLDGLLETVAKYRDECSSELYVTVATGVHLLPIYHTPETYEEFYVKMLGYRVVDLRRIFQQYTTIRHVVHNPEVLAVEIPNSFGYQFINRNVLEVQP